MQSAGLQVRCRWVPAQPDRVAQLRLQVVAHGRHCCACACGIPEFQLQFTGHDVQAIADQLGQLWHEPALLCMKAVLHFGLRQRSAGDVAHALRAIRPWMCLIGRGCWASQSNDDIPTCRVVHPDSGEACRVARFQTFHQCVLLRPGDRLARRLLADIKEGLHLRDLGGNVGGAVAGRERRRSFPVGVDARGSGHLQESGDECGQQRDGVVLREEPGVRGLQRSPA
ncbi:hypothetical protein DFO63_3817 [Stenotrophomonas sp. AG209]|nr:hypothetical protein DFO63_3817 [Stenotrophomonas sp. AG209]